jgi:sigma-B regulation protein RsbU (phosphoserine phosphatase)
MIHSDGVVECTDPGGALLDDNGLARLLADLRQTRGMACLESLLWKLVEFAETDDLTDDVSAILLEFKPSPIVG